MQPSPSVPVSEPQYVPPEPYRPRPQGRFRFETLMTFCGVLIGVLVFGGLLAVHAVYLVPVPCTAIYGCSPPNPDLAAYGATLRALAWIAVVALDLAAGMSVALAFIFGARSDFPESVRRSLFVFATVFFAAWVIGGFLMMTILGIVRYY